VEEQRKTRAVAEGKEEEEEKEKKKKKKKKEPPVLPNPGREKEPTLYLPRGTHGSEASMRPGGNQ